MNSFGNESRTYQMPWKSMSFIDDIQTNPSLFFMEFVVRRGGDVTDANAMEFIHLNVHPCT
jgi:hypothetical protein